MQPIKLQNVIDEMELQMEEYKTFLNKKTGEIISVRIEDLSNAEESDEDEDFSYITDSDERESAIAALDIIVNWKDYAKLPDEHDINEYEIMDDFCGSISNERLSNSLFNAIKGRGAFRRFKDLIIKLNVENDWYRFRDEALKNIAIAWCEENKISYLI